jgi:hypothetical protein
LLFFFLLAYSLIFHADFLSASTGGDVKIWPLFYHASDPVSQETRTEIIWPLYVRQQTTDYTANQLLSFPQKFPQHYPKQYYLFWPFGGVRAGNGHDAWLFPLLWSGAAAGGDKWRHSLFPLYYFGKNRDVYSLNIALLQHNVWDKTGRFNMLFPLLWSSAEKTDTQDQFSFGLLPLGWVYGDNVKTPEHSSQSNWAVFFCSIGGAGTSQSQTMKTMAGKTQYLPATAYSRFFSEKTITGPPPKTATRKTHSGCFPIIKDRTLLFPGNQMWNLKTYTNQGTSFPRYGGTIPWNRTRPKTFTGSCFPCGGIRAGMPVKWLKNPTVSLCP